MLVNFKDSLMMAQARKYAVGAFNGYNYETFKGIVDAGRECEQPVILAFGAKYLANMSLETAYAMAKSLAAEQAQPVCLHLDHCSDINTVYRAIRVGFNSVMYDGSALPLVENMKNTQQICAAAHACKVTVEAELGCLAAGERSHEGSSDDVAAYTDPLQAQQFANATGVDALAVSIGTVHGLYKGEPKLRLDLLKKIRALVKTPLVLHGGSGLARDDIFACIANGIVKININTEISVHAVERTVQELAQGQPHFSELSLHQIGYVKEIAKKYIAFFGGQRKIR